MPKAPRTCIACRRVGSDGLLAECSLVDVCCSARREVIAFSASRFSGSRVRATDYPRRKNRYKMEEAACSKFRRRRGGFLDLLRSTKTDGILNCRKMWLTHLA